VSVDRGTKIPLCEDCSVAFAVEHHALWIEDLLSRPLDIERPEPEELDVEAMLGIKTRRFMPGGDPSWPVNGGLPSLGKGYS
jgi:hypothetical protein